ncbi:MAG: hypothetical protein ACLFQV_06230 [Vulcanimicrobiota bacterium]
MRKFFIITLALLLMVFSYQVVFAGVSDSEKEIPRFDLNKDAIAVGSFGGYSGYGGFWGLNDYFIGLMGHYFTLEQMKEIDRQIQDIMGITDKAYNYCSEGGTGYYYNTDTDSWTYSGGRAGKTYTELIDKSFLIDIETAQVVSVFSTRNESGVHNYGNFFNGSYARGLVGKKMKIGNVNYSIVGARNWSPIVLDLDNDGIVDTNRNEWTPHAPDFYGERTGYFDLTGDNRVEFCEWLGANDGLLVMPDANGTVRGANDLFGTAGGYSDGYAKMSEVLDADKNGWVEGAELEGLYVWQDKNSNASCEIEELTPVSELNIQRIATTHRNFESVYYRDGREYKTWDWWPTGYEVVKTR